MPHLISALIVCGFVAAILFAGRTIAIHLEQKTISSTAPKLFSLKNQGLAFQRAAVNAPDVVPLYGSSELLWPVQKRASDFFRTAPTGFQISPVGKPGATTMTILQKIGALGSDLRGKKVVISLSSEWFFIFHRRDWYKGNFSLLAASELIFSGDLDFSLKRDIASVMLEFPDTLAKSPLLEFALRRLVSASLLDRFLFCALWPIGKTQTVLMELQDHFAALNYTLRQGKSAPPRRLETINWSELIAKADEPRIIGRDKDPANAAGPVEHLVPPWANEHAFRKRLEVDPEWTDLELLLRVLAKIHARPLLLCMPLDGQVYDKGGISRSAREAFYTKLRVLTQRYDFPLVEFKEHESDPNFLDRQSTHLTAKGWMFYNRALDDFFHGRVPRG
jgi:D-alanine transfer protein